MLAQVDPNEATFAVGTELVRSVRDGLADHADPTTAGVIRARHHEQVGLSPPESFDRGQRPDLGQRAAADLTAERVRCIERLLLLVLDEARERSLHDVAMIGTRRGGDDIDELGAQTIRESVADPRGEARIS